MSHEVVTKPDHKSNEHELTARKAEQAQTRANGHKPRAHEVERAQTAPPRKYKPTEVKRARIQTTLKDFEAMVRKDLAGPGPYPTYILTTILKLAATSANPFPAIA